MIRRKYVVYKFHAEEAPGDLVERHSTHFTLRGAKREAERMGGSTIRWDEKSRVHVYYRASKLPKKIPKWRRRRR